MPRSDTLTFGFEKDRKILESCLDILRASRVLYSFLVVKKGMRSQKISRRCGIIIG
jgi:hypothetical protein